jgi:AcrR family transcriptional regulator
MTASSSPAPVPSGGIRARRRDQILTTAAELFATKGYPKTSMRDVATASGILAGSLYHHFDSKEAIAVELVESCHADLVDAVRTFGSVDTDQLTALRLFTREVTEVPFRHQAALQIRMFDAPPTARSSLKTVSHADPSSLNQRWRTLIIRAPAAHANRRGAASFRLRSLAARAARRGRCAKGFCCVWLPFVPPVPVSRNRPD